MKIYLIRHGETLGNKKGCYVGTTDEELSDEGKQKLLDKKSGSYYPSCEGAVFYTSSLTRAKQTLNLIYGDVEYTEDARFNESNFGDFENKTYEELKNNEDYISWISGDNMSNVCPNGESYVQMQKRVLEAFEEIVDKYKESDKNVIIVLHGGPIVAIMQKLNPNSNKTFYDWKLASGEYYEI